MVLTAVTIEIPFSRNMTACRLVYAHQSIQNHVPKNWNTVLTRFWFSKYLVKWKHLNTHKKKATAGNSNSYISERFPLLGGKVEQVFGG